MTATTGELHAYLAADTTPAARKHVYGPGCWCRPIRDEVGALVHGDVDMEAEGARHLDTVRSLVASAKATAEAVRERDEARAALARVRALAARWDVVADQAMFGEYRELVASAATSLRAALDGSQP